MKNLGDYSIQEIATFIILYLMIFIPIIGILTIGNKILQKILKEIWIGLLIVLAIIIPILFTLEPIYYHGK